MKEMNKFFKVIFCLLVLTKTVESKTLSIGSTDAKVTVKVFSSLTCPHCANFHMKIFSDLKRDYIDKGLVKFEHYAFPLDLAALNAEIIVRCQTNNSKKIELLDEIYNKQKLWAVGSDIVKINDLIMKVGKDFDLTKQKMEACLNSAKAQDEILNERIEAQKKYKIESTPTIIVNEKRYLDKVDYKKFKKIIEKNL